MKTFSFTLLLILIGITWCHAEDNAPQLLVAVATPGWTNPVISPDGKAVAYTDEFYRNILVKISGEDSPRKIALGEGVGRRFVFEPGSEPRIVYRGRLDALPLKPERLISCSIYAHDPVHRTKNDAGSIYGPYVIDRQVRYTQSLDQPLVNYAGDTLREGVRWDWDNGRISIVNHSGEVVFSSPAGNRMAGAEISPNGEWVAAVQSDPTRELFIIHISDGKILSLGDGYDPAWSGDAQNLVYAAPSGDTGSLLRLSHSPFDSSRIILNSPDYHPEVPALDQNASRVVFAANGALYEMNISH